MHAADGVSVQGKVNEGNSLEAAPTVTPTLHFEVGLGGSKGKGVGKSWKRLARSKNEGIRVDSSVDLEGAVGGKRDRMGDSEMVDVEGMKKAHVHLVSGWREAEVVMEQPRRAP